MYSGTSLNPSNTLVQTICSFHLVLICIVFGFLGRAFGQATEVVATLNGKPITMKEVDDSVASRIVPIQQQLYALRKVALENIVTKRLIEGEAARRKVSPEVLRKQLMEGSIDVTREQVEAAYVENASFFATMSPDEARERLRLDLETRARLKHYRDALERLRKSASLDVNLSPPSDPLNLELGSAPVLGSPDSAITIVEFSDFECPFCKAVQPTLKQILTEYAGRVKLVFKYLPLEMHRTAFAAAKGAYCAGKQDRFWQYHDSLFNSRDNSSESLIKLAKGLGLNPESFHTCMESAEASNAIRTDQEQANRLGIASTPTFVINGNRVAGAINFAAFQKIIDRELNLPGLNASSLK